MPMPSPTIGIVQADSNWHQPRGVRQLALNRGRIPRGAGEERAVACEKSLSLHFPIAEIIPGLGSSSEPYRCRDPIQPPSIASIPAPTKKPTRIRPLTFERPNREPSLFEATSIRDHESIRPPQPMKSTPRRRLALDVIGPSYKACPPSSRRPSCRRGRPRLGPRRLPGGLAGRGRLRRTRR